MNQAVFFDFDGTLVDTFDGIIAAVQGLRAELGGGPLPPAEVRRHIGWGVSHLLAQCHPRGDDRRTNRLPAAGTTPPVSDDQVAMLVPQFRRIYGQVMMLHTRAYPGMLPLCRRLVARGLPLAVVSNKPERFVRQILAATALCDAFGLVLGGDSLAVRKPDPEPLRHAAAQLGVALAGCVMVGDGHLDIEVAHAAGIPSCGVTWGLTSEDRMRELRPTHVVPTVEQLATCLDALLEP